MLLETRTRIRKPLWWGFGLIENFPSADSGLSPLAAVARASALGFVFGFCGRLCQWTSGRPADWLPMVFFMIRSIATCNEPLVSAEGSATRAASHTHLLGSLVHWRASICPDCTSRCGLSRILDRCELEGAEVEYLLGGDLCQHSHSISAGVFAQRRSSLRLELVTPQTYREVSGEYTP